MYDYFPPFHFHHHHFFPFRSFHLPLITLFLRSTSKLRSFLLPFIFSFLFKLNEHRKIITKDKKKMTVIHKKHSIWFRPLDVFIDKINNFLNFLFTQHLDCFFLAFFNRCNPIIMHPLFLSCRDRKDTCK